MTLTEESLIASALQLRSTISPSLPIAKICKRNLSLADTNSTNSTPSDGTFPEDAKLQVCRGNANALRTRSPSESVLQEFRGAKSRSV